MSSLLTLVLGICCFFTAYSSQAQTQPTLLIVGDSLSAEYGLQQGEGWVALLQKRLLEKNLHYTIINTSVSGDTTEQGKNQLNASLKRYQPKIVIIALGSNDALRGLPLNIPKQNLEWMVQQVKKNRALPIIVGNRIPNNYGKKYTTEFYEMFQQLVPVNQTVPFMLNGFAERQEMFQADGLHPIAAAQSLILDNIWPILQPHL